MLIKLIPHNFNNKFYYPSSSYLHSETKEFINIFLTARNENNISYIFIVKIKKNNFKVISVSEPIIKLGETSDYDKFGSSYPCLFKFKKSRKLYYTGWSDKSKHKYLNTLCSAELNKNKFTNSGKKTLILGSNGEKINEIGSVDIVHKHGLNYLFFTKFKKWINNQPFYTISLAVSENLKHWKERKSFDFINDKKINKNLKSKPSIIFKYNKWWMFFCHRNIQGDYKIALSVSNDLINWNLLNSNIFKSLKLPNWCIKGQCYPNIIETIEMDLLLFFAGNRYGRDGFGVFKISDFKELI